MDWSNSSLPVAPWLSATWAGNSLQAWGLAALCLVGVVLGLRLAKALLVGRLRKLVERTTTRLDDAWVQVLDSPAWLGYLGAGLLAGTPFLELDGWRLVVDRAVYILLGIQCALWLQRIVTSLLDLWTSGKAPEAEHVGTAAAAIRFISRIVIWAVLLLVVLSSFGVELTSVIAGLGVGGIAAALAVQKVLGDLFAGLSMYFDRPFDIGDFIMVGDVLGNVTKIGLRTTRIDSLGGEEVVYPNGELAGKCIRNYNRMKQRRIVFAFGIEYNLPAAKVARARDIAREVVEEQAGIRFDRAHFKGFGAYSLDFEVVYYVLSREYGEYMDKQHAINLALYERFEAEAIPFALPTHTVHLHAEHTETA